MVFKSLYYRENIIVCFAFIFQRIAKNEHHANYMREWSRRKGEIEETDEGQIQMKRRKGNRVLSVLK